MSRSTTCKPEPHPGVAGLAIAVMGLVLAWVLEYLGALTFGDRRLSAWVNGIGLEGATRMLDPWIPWAWTVVITLGLCQSVLHVRGSWRRVVLTISTVVLTLCWIPVLALAAIHPPVMGALVALLWGGVGSCIYASRHREPEE
ncbi:MAG: hypothetical protein ACQKBU_12450 [Verrucomicrobiales bacterium]